MTHLLEGSVLVRDFCCPAYLTRPDKSGECYVFHVTVSHSLAKGLQQMHLTDGLRPAPLLRFRPRDSRTSLQQFYSLQSCEGNLRHAAARWDSATCRTVTTTVNIHSRILLLRLVMVHSYVYQKYSPPATSINNIPLHSAVSTHLL